MTPGALWLKLRQALDGGPRAAWYRSMVRPRICRRTPIAVSTTADAEVHALTSAGDWQNLCWGLASFFHFAGTDLRLAIHGDGSLPPVAIETLEGLFPGARVLQSPAQEAAMAAALAACPQVAAFRAASPLARKIVDFFLSAAVDRVLVFDSDLMFFHRPEGLLARRAARGTNFFNADVASAYVIDADQARRHFGIELVERVNSGLGWVDRASIRLDWLEEFLSLETARAGHFWRIEQTLFALCSSRHGVQLLPREYDLRLEGDVGDRPFRHYVGAIRSRLYAEGIRRVAPQLL